jgi:hypothetical protein
MFISGLKAPRETVGFAKGSETQCHLQLSFLIDVMSSLRLCLCLCLKLARTALR